MSVQLTIVDESKIPDSLHCTFDDFWLLYYRHEAKKDARKAWGQVVTPANAVEVIVAAANWRKVWARRGCEIHHVPLAATWLRGERFDDELPPEVQSLAAAHQPAVLPVSAPRTELPQRVRDLLAKLRR